jgi:hypothetical protein
MKRAAVDVQPVLGESPIFYPDDVSASESNRTGTSPESRLTLADLADVSAENAEAHPSRIAAVATIAAAVGACTP